ncbi:MAG: Gfo/Idh/MocA family oxidoreductase [Candidatus Sumerlaeia bacterium]|nr:Gfo/Idh/MocA family oxidoreductase [Candidatus Sumerlaeia bacterium]
MSAPSSPDTLKATAPQQIWERRRVRVAVVGVGHLGQHHARIYSEMADVDLVAVCDANREQAQKVARNCRTQALFDHRQLLGQVDAVSIAVPTALHFGLAKDFLESGTHTLVEKPITTTIQEASELIDISRRCNRILQVGHIERFNAAVVKLREIIEDPVYIVTERLGPYNARVRDVGVVLDLMIHDIDIVLQLVNSRLRRIDALGIGIFSEFEDLANARLEFENGCVVNLNASRVSVKATRKIRIFQPSAYITLNYEKQKLDVYYRSELQKLSNRGLLPAIPRPRKFRLRRAEQLSAELSHFLDCVRHGRTPDVTGEHGLNALEIAVEISKQIREKVSAYRATH